MFIDDKKKPLQHRNVFYAYLYLRILCGTYMNDTEELHENIVDGTSPKTAEEEIK